MTIKTLSLRIEDRGVKHLRGKKTASMKVVWGGPAGGSVTWELESMMIKSYPELFPSGNFLGWKFLKCWRVVTSRFN